MKTSTIGARVPSEVRNSVAKLSAMSGQSVSAITEKALKEYTAWRIPQFTDLQAAIAAADRAEFATDAEAEAFFAKHGA